MKHFTHFAADAHESVPEIRFGGNDKDLVILDAGDLNVHLTEVDDLPAWLREFAERLTTFADLVEDRGVGIPPAAPALAAVPSARS